MAQQTILIVDPSPDQPEAAATLPGFDTVRVRSVGEALETLYRGGISMLMVDDALNAEDAGELMACAGNLKPDLPVAVMAEPGQMDRAMQRYQTAVTDYLHKPVSPTALSLALCRGGRKRGNEDAADGLTARLAAAAHTVYGMLTALDGGIYQLESGLAQEDLRRIHSGLETVRGTCLKLRRLMMDILEHARAGTSQVRAADLANIVRSAVAAVAGEASRAGGRVTADLAPGLPAAAVDPLRFQAALERLLKAALTDLQKSAPGEEQILALTLQQGEGGALRLKIRPAAGGPSRVSVNGSDPDAALNRLGSFVAGHMIRAQGGRFVGEDVFLADGWTIEVPASPGPGSGSGALAGG